MLKSRRLAQVTLAGRPKAGGRGPWNPPKSTTGPIVWLLRTAVAVSQRWATKRGPGWVPPKLWKFLWTRH